MRLVEHIAQHWPVGGTSPLKTPALRYGCEENKACDLTLDRVVRKGLKVRKNQKKGFVGREEPSQM